MMDGKIEREKKRCVGERNEGKEGIKKGQGHMEPKPFNPPHTTDSLVRVRPEETENGIAYRFVVDDKGFVPSYIPCNQT